MQFNLAPGYTLTVRISRKPIVMEGKPRDGHIDDARRIVWISRDVPRKDRRRILSHELQHGWIYARGGKPEGDEAACKDVSAFTEMFVEQLDAQGGTPALMAMEPRESKSIETDVAPTAGIGSVMLVDRCECRCGAYTMIFDVHTGRPEFDKRFNEFTVMRWFVCEPCGRLLTWRETALQDGTPTGRLVINSLQELTGEEKIAWLRAQREMSAA